MIRCHLKSERFSPEGSISGGAIRRNLGRSHLDALSLLIRESVQNSWDARIDKEGGCINYEAHLKTATATQAYSLREELFGDVPEGHPLGPMLSAGLGMLVLRDSGTLGLNGPLFHVPRTGPEQDRTRNFIRFVRDIGRGASLQRGGGTYGFGKSSLFTASGAGTIIAYSRSREPDGSLEDRLIGLSLWSPSDDEQFTGRHWWGIPMEEGMGPVRGAEAADLAHRIGIPRFVAGESGTSIAVLAPLFVEPYRRVDHETARVVAETFATWFWPRMEVSPSGRPWIGFSVSIEGRPVPMPRPAEVEPFSTMVRSLRALRGGHPDGLETHEIRSEKPQALLGRLGLGPLGSPHKATLWGGLKIEGHVLTDLLDLPDGGADRAHHVALLRSTWQVIRYLPCSPVGARGQGYAGVFMVDEDPAMEEAFAQSEPPAHDDWLPDGLDDESQKRFVRIALRRIRTACDSMVEAIGNRIDIRPGAEIARLSARLGAQLLAGPPRSIRRGVGRKVMDDEGKGAVALRLDDQERVEWIDGRRVVVLRFSSPKLGQDQRIAVTPTAGIVLVGGATERQSEASGDGIRMLGWRSVGGGGVNGSKELVLSSDSPRRWELLMEIPRGCPGFGRCLREGSGHMNCIVIPPHRMADPGSVRPPQWVTEKEGMLVGDRLDHWVPTDELILTGRLELDLNSFIGSTGLSHNDEVVVVASWMCTTTHQRGSHRSSPDTLIDGPAGHTLRLSIPAGSADGCILVKAAVCLHHRRSAQGDPSVASETGSILWQDHPVGRPVSLGAARFPVACVDFKASGLGEVGSSWRIVMDSQDLEAPVARVVRLYINRLNEALVRSLTSDSKDPQAGQIQGLLRFAVERELVMAALRCHERLGLGDWKEGSFGALLRSTLRRRFPDCNPRAVASRLASDPTGFEVELQARLGFLQPV